MKTILYKIFLSLAIFSMVSCSDYLGNKPKGYSIPQYYEDYAILLNGNNLVFVGLNHPLYMTDDVALAEKNVPNSVVFSQKRASEQSCYNFKSGDIFLEGEKDWFYVDCYSQIYVCNVVANSILDVPDGTLENRETTWAEALVHRAYIYLQLVNVYATHYDQATASTDYGVPIILSEDINNTYIRNTVAQVYDLIIDDLENAIPKLSNIAANNFNPNKSAAYALLARTYLFMGKFDLALSNAEKALAANKTASLVDYKEYTALYGEIRNRIVDENEIPFPTKGINLENMFMKLPMNDLSSYIFASDDLVESFTRNLPNGAIDKRYELFYSKDKAHTFAAMEFPGYTMYIAHVMPNMGITLQEIYLMLAECEARIGSKDKALSYLDILRDRRIVGNQPLTASTNDEALSIALDERRREMAFVGHARFIDLRRLNKEERFAKDVVHMLDGEEYVLPANDPRYIMPLPFSVREFNKDIPQYER